MSESEVPTIDGQFRGSSTPNPGSTSSFDLLVDRLRAGDDEAAVRVFQRFARRLISQAQTNLDSAIRQKVDPEDVVQSVFKSFFLRQREGQFEFENWDSIWGLLTLITLRKCRNRFDYYYAARRDVRREVTADASQAGLDVLATEPSPEEAAVLTETIERLLNDLDNRDREMFALQLQGYTIQEISDRVGRAERTVRRVLQRIKKRLLRIQQENESP